MMVGREVSIDENPPTFVSTTSSVNWYVYAKDDGNIPGISDLTLDGRSIHLKETPTASGHFVYKHINQGNFVDDYAIIDIQVAKALKITSPADKLSGSINKIYRQQLTATGGFPPYKWTTNQLPKGLKLENGLIAGTPTETFNKPVTIMVTDEMGYSFPQTFNFKVAADALAVTKTLPAGHIGTAYNQPLKASGGVAPYAWTTTSKLPEGVTLENGAITGAPLKSFGGKVVITVKDSDTTAKSIDAEFDFKVSADALAVTKTLPAGHVGTAYNQPLKASGGVAPYAWTTTSKLPEGVTLEKGAITGTPLKPFDGKVVITVKDSDTPAKSIDAELQLKILLDIPQAQSLIINVLAGRTASIDLTSGAVGGPITSADIVSDLDASVGRAWIEKEGSAMKLYFTPSAFFSGKSELKYTLSNAYGASNPAVVILNVIARPDPSKDPEVIALIHAQVETADRLGNAQVANFQRRLEQLHNENDCRQSSFDLNLNMEGGQIPLSSRTLRDDKAGGCTMLQRKLAMWTSGQVNFGHDRNDDQLQKQYTNTAISGGIDYRFSPTFIGGIGFGYGSDKTEIGSHNTQNQGNLFAVTAYSSYQINNGLFLDTLLGYGWLDFNSDRFVTHTGGRAFGSRNGTQLYGSVALGYNYHDNSWSFSPYLRTDARQTNLDAFSETSADVFNLTYGAQKIRNFSGTIGGTVGYKIPFEKVTVTPHARLEYTHDFTGSSKAKLEYADMSGVFPYAVDINLANIDRVTLEGGIDVATYDKWAFAFSYRTQFTPNVKSMQHGFGWKLSKYLN